MKDKTSQGFTLIELSIVLVIIGLIVGGILVGQVMIKSSELRAQISQVEKFASAVNAFRGKYGALPGDIHVYHAARMGMFTMTGTTAGTMYGNSNNRIDLNNLGIGGLCRNECGVFWRHLSDAGLLSPATGATIESNTNTPCGAGVPIGSPSPACNQFDVTLYLPKAKTRGYVAVDYFLNNSPYNLASYGHQRAQNIFFISEVDFARFGNYRLGPSLSPIDSHGIDSKIDDGMPNTGKVLANSSSQTPTAWSATVNSSSVVCTYGGANVVALDIRYNTNPNTGGNTIACVPVFLW